MRAKTSMHSIVIVIFLILINLITIGQFRLSINHLEKEKSLLEQNYQNLSADHELFKHAWATSVPDLSDRALRTLLPENYDSGSIAIRLSESNCSSCVDELLFQVMKHLPKSCSHHLIVLYTANNIQVVKTAIRTRLLKEARFVEIPDFIEVTTMDELNIPYLLSINSQGQIISTFLPYHVEEELIGIYLKETLETLNQST